MGYPSIAGVAVDAVLQVSNRNALANHNPVTGYMG